MAEPKNPPVIPTSQSRPSSEPPDEGWAELETTIEVSPSNRQVALEQAVALSSAAVRTHGGPPSTQDWQRVLDRALAAADRFHAWLTQDEEPVDDIEHPPQVGLGATDHGCDE